MPVTEPGHVLDGDVLLAVARPDTPRSEPPADQPLVLSRFAWLRRDGEQLIVESALAAGTIALVHPNAARFVTSFGAPTTIAAAASDAGVGERAARALATLLLGCGALVLGDADEDRLPLAVWEFHDLLFHARSRAGRSTNPFGGTYRFAGRLEPAPPLPAARWPPTVRLAPPDLERLEREDPPLSALVSARRSIRTYGEPPVHVNELGELLYRCARIDDVWVAPGADPRHPVETYTRPYPSGGALYELEFYVLTQQCDGIDPGLYHYAAGEHALERIDARSAEVTSLAARVGMGAMLRPGAVQALILLTARMQRIAWKYESLAYALVLKHVGVVYESLYLAATAMRLAPCAIGGGDSDMFATIAGIDYFEEPLVGEFAVGRPAPEPEPRAAG